MAKSIQSIEPNIADLVNGWLKSYQLDYKLEQEPLNDEIDKALKDYFTKNGGAGANRPDAKLLLQDKDLGYYPILIEYKGYPDKLVKKDSEGNVENRTTKNEPHFKNINEYAVNGAVHYANALLHHTSFTDIIAIGVTGEKDNKGNIIPKIGVYYVAKTNLGVGQEVAQFTDLSFLKKENFDAFVQQIKNLSLSPEEFERIKQQREQEIDASLTKLNNDIYQNEKGLGENDRVYLVAAAIIATLGVAGKVAPLEKSDLKSSPETGNRDGDIVIRKIQAFLKERDLAEDKRDLIIRTLSNTLLTDNINKATNGESQLRRVFTKIVDDLGIYYKIGLTTDFTGKLFNEMYAWLGFSQDKLNDVVLTPSYVATLLVKLARVGKDSYVWDFATGSAGLLVAAMNEMLADAKESIASPDALRAKEAHIKAKQLLGVELLPSVYILAVLNMIMMGDGSSNILNKDSLTDFDGHYLLGENIKFPADAFVLNPPYSAPGNGMIFVETALNMMQKGYAAIIIQNSAGSGKAKEFNQRILEQHTLVASIKMPVDLFIGKSSVQTNIYVFKVGEKHQKEEIVKFIDFSNDGYSRSGRKNSKNNLKDTHQAKERYAELVKLVRFGKSQLHIFTEKEYYEGTIDPKNGADWNQSAPIDTIPTLSDIKKTVTNYLAWEVSSLLKRQATPDEHLGKIDDHLTQKLQNVKWAEFLIGDLFEIENTLSFNKELLTEGATYDYVTRTSQNQGILQETGFVNSENINSAGNWSLGLLQMDFFYRDKPWYAGQFVRKITPKIKLDNKKVILFFTVLLNKQKSKLLSVLVRDVDNTFRNSKITLPTKDGAIDFAFMEDFISELEKQPLTALENYLTITGLKDYTLTEDEEETLNSLDKV